MTKDEEAATVAAVNAGIDEQLALRSDAIALATLVVDYFGTEDIPPVLDGDIELRDAALAFLTKAGVSR